MTAMFLGPTGVGKTEAGKALAKFLYPRDWETRLLRIDCTNLSENHSVSSLKGSEPGYIGYGDNNILITPDFLDRGGVIILDEFEKAAPKVKKWFLPVFEEGQQTAMIPKEDGKGWQSEQRTLNFANSHIIVTSNVGAEALHKARTGHSLGFTNREAKPDMQKIGISELRKSFADMPELLGRMDSIIVFEELERPELERIFNKFIDEINQDQRYGHNFLAVTKEARDFVIDHAETGEYGAREIRHKLNTHIVDKAAEIKYSGVLPDMQPIIADIENDEVIFWTSKVEEKKSLPVLPDIKDLDEINEDLPIQSQRDPGSYIGNREKPRRKFHPRNRKQEDTGDEDIRGPKGEYEIEVTYKDDTKETIHDGLDDLVSEVEMNRLANDPKYEGKDVKSARKILKEEEQKLENKPLSFVIPAEGVIFDSMDMAITIRAGGHEYLQVLEGLPIVRSK